MSRTYATITDAQAALIGAARVFFVASADPDLAPHEGLGAVNVSPKGAVPLHVISERRVAYLDYPGSGNETARHAAAGGPVTIMVCSFDDDDAAIVRLYGTASVVPVEASPLADRLLDAASIDLAKRARQVVSVDVTSTMTSCGYGVPVMHFVRDRRRSDRGRAYKD